MNKLILTGIIIWVAENIYFGWNMQPSCGMELFWDYVATAFVVGGFYQKINLHLKDIQELKEDIKELKEDIKELKEMHND